MFSMSLVVVLCSFLLVTSAASLQQKHSDGIKHHQDSHQISSSSSLRSNLEKLNIQMIKQIQKEVNSSRNLEVVKSLVKLHGELEKFRNDETLENESKWKTIKAISTKIMKETCEILNIKDLDQCAVKLKILQTLFGIKETATQFELALEKAYDQKV